MSGETKEPVQGPAPENDPYALIDKKTEAWKSKVAKGYQEHAHCHTCGRAIHEGKKYCSIECRDKVEKMQGKQKKQQKWMYVLMCTIVPVMMLVMTMFSGGG